MLNASRPAPVDQSLTHAMTHETIRSTPVLARTPPPVPPRLGLQATASTQLHTPRQTHHATSSATFHPSLHSDSRVSGQRQDAGSQFSQFKSTCSRSTPRPESHSFLPSRAQSLFEHGEEFEESTSALPRTSYASVYSRDHAVHDRPHVPPAAPFVPVPAVRTDDLERRLRELSEENERLRRSQAESERRTHQGDPSTDQGSLASAIVGAIQALRPASADPGLEKFVAWQAVAGKELPTFAGDAEEWPTFITLFQNSTKECGFTNAENLARLHKSLRGKAKDAVQALLTVPDNVPDVIRSLGRSDAIV